MHTRKTEIEAQVSKILLHRKIHALLPELNELLKDQPVKENKGEGQH